jgi:hypothetical protein
MAQQIVEPRVQLDWIVRRNCRALVVTINAVFIQELTVFGRLRSGVGRLRNRLRANRRRGCLSGLAYQQSNGSEAC